MELSILFTALVLAVGALHLIWKLTPFLNRDIAVSAEKHDFLKKKSVQRSDWYVFFYCSDLTRAGKAENRNARINMGSGNATKKDRKRFAHRPQRQRYVS